MIKKGGEIKCVVLSVDQSKQRIALGLKQLAEDPWLHAVPERYIPGMIVRGKVTKITNFGVFVELETDLEGLLHVSELTDRKIEDPHDEVEIGQDIDVKILRVDATDRKIGLSKKRADWAADGTDDAAGERTSPGGPAKARRGGLHGAGEETTDIISGTVLLHEMRLEEAKAQVNRLGVIDDKASESEGQATDKAEAGDQATDKAEAGDQAADKAEADDQAADKAEADDQAADKAEAGDQATDKAEAGDQATDKAEAGDQATDKAEAGDQAADKAEAGN
jgi:small subunit ribosomal protein S1